MSRLKEHIGTLKSTKRCVTQGRTSDLYAISGSNSSSSLTIPLYIGFEMFSSVVISMRANIEFI